MCVCCLARWPVANLFHLLTFLGFLILEFETLAVCLVFFVGNQMYVLFELILDSKTTKICFRFPVTMIPRHHCRCRRVSVSIDSVSIKIFEHSFVV